MAIANATAALRNTLRKEIARIAPDLSDLLVTARSPDHARSDSSVPQLNLFLLSAPVDRSLRNGERLDAREEAIAALGVSLHYLLTVYGRDKDEDGDLVCHRLLGAAMSVMHRPSLFDNADIAPLRISSLEMTAREMATLWSSFRTPYRLSAAYAVGVVTIENT